MKFVQVTRTGQYTDLAVFGLPLGRLLVWTALVAVLHRFLCIGLMFLGFVVGSAGFAPGHPNAGSHMSAIWAVQTALDFPILFLNHIGLVHANFLAGSGFLEPLGSGLQLVWSVIVGLAVAILISRRSSRRDSRART
jgi:hypothetical protein